VQLVVSLRRRDLHVHRLSNRVIAALFILALFTRPCKAAMTPCLVDQEALALVRDLGSLLPEFRTDLWTRLLERGKLCGSGAAEIAARAFDLAGGVRQPVPVQPVPLGLADTAAAMSGFAARLEVDRLSLRCRSVERMLALNPLRAVKMLQAIEHPAVAPPTCASDRIPNYQIYYNTLLHVAGRAGLSPSAVSRIVLPRAVSLPSASHVFLTAELLAELPIDRPGLERLVDAFIRAVRFAHSDDRTFSVELYTEPRLDRLGRLCRRVQDPDRRRSLLLVFADYCDRHLRASRCSDTFSDQEHRRQRASALGSLNASLLRLGNSDHAALVDGTRTPEPARKAVDFWTEVPEYSRLMSAVRKLNGSGRSPLSLAERARPEWRSQILDLLKQTSRFSSPSLSAHEMFLAKSQVYVALVAAAQGASITDYVDSTALSFLTANADEETEHPQEWLWRLLQILYGTPHAVLTSPQDLDYGRLVRLADKFPHPVIRAYARLLRLGHPTGSLKS
jgi:hypothetical protein